MCKNFLRQLFHPARRGLPDPTWSQVAIGMIALGSFSIALATVTASTETFVTHINGQTITKTVVSPQPVLVWFGGVVVVLGLLSLMVIAVSALHRRAEDNKTPFVIEFDDDITDCCEDGTRDITRFNEAGVPVESVTGHWRQLRVRVTNRGPIGVQRVRAYLTVLEGTGRNRNHFLHLQHDNSYSTSRDGEYLTTGQITFFDVAVVHLDEPGPGFYFCYSDQGISNASRVEKPPVRFKVRITISGWSDFRDVVSLYQDYEVNWAGDQNVSLRPLGSNVTGRA